MPRTAKPPVWGTVFINHDGSRELFRDPGTKQVAIMGKTEAFNTGFIFRDMPGPVKTFFVKHVCTECHGEGCYDCDDLGYWG
jgi:hypothetical protein